MKTLRRTDDDFVSSTGRLFVLCKSSYSGMFAELESPGMGYLREFLSNPTVTGSITPSSSHLARTIVEGLDLRSAAAVLEYGPGSGVFTEFVLRELRPGAKFAAIELNPHFAEAFKLRYPDVLLFEDSVSNVEGLCKRAGVRSVDCIVSGLPWATFPESLQVECLDAMMRVLKPGGWFATFSYVHSLALTNSRRFADRLPKYFKTVSKSPVVWRNMPPAFVYRCRR
jgi:phosphatidylethanolamine/phosphatidyl-N-methylethanolamine N-methyltransferase